MVYKNHIYSDECLDLTDKLEEIENLDVSLYGVEFTTETGEETEQVLQRIARKMNALSCKEKQETLGAKNILKNNNNFGHFYRPVQWFLLHNEEKNGTL